MTPHNLQETPGQEYSYPRWLVALAMGGVLWVLAAVWVGLVMARIIGESDLRYLSEWPWWMTSGLLALSSLMFGVTVFAFYVLARNSAFALWHFRDRITLTDGEIVFERGHRRVAIGWQEVSVCRHHLFAARVFSREAEWWVLPIGKEMRDLLAQIETHRVGAQRPVGRRGADSDRDADA